MSAGHWDACFHEIANIQREVAVLRVAQLCVDANASPAVIRGRLDDLIADRRDRMTDLIRLAAESETTTTRDTHHV